MSSTRKSLKIIESPSRLDGGLIGRVVKVLDASEGEVGAWRIETWIDGRWKNGGASLSEFFWAGGLSANQREALGLPDDAEPPDNPDD
jgi:hypothetical protein